MNVKLINICDNYAKVPSDYIPSHGLSYLIETEDKKILFDAGDDEKIFKHNMDLLNIDPKAIDLLILSHGHYDHTFGIPTLLDQRDDKSTLKVVAHPHALLSRKNRFPYNIRAYLKYRLSEIGFPDLTMEQMKKIDFDLTTESKVITPFLITTGEIAERKERDSTNPKIKIKTNGKWERDLVLDDLSLILKTKEGLVIICGCGHSGILNICERAKQLQPNDKIKLIVGGTHLVVYDEEELEHLAQKLLEDYGKPLLYLSHCTGNKAVNFLKSKFGKDFVHSFKVGDELNFEC